MQKMILTVLMSSLAGIALASPGPDPIGNETAMADESKTTTDTPVATEGAEPSEAFVPPAGYRAKKMGDKLMYCREEKVTGTRFRSEKCYSEARLKELVAEREKATRDFEQSRAVCSNPATCSQQ